METTRMTNGLLLGIFLTLLAHLGARFWDGQEAVAETFQLDGCITASASEKPQGYVHVVTHSAAAR